MKKIFTLMLTAVSLAACTSQKAETDSNILVLYYSQVGATKTVAQELQKQLGADIEAIEAQNPYTGDFGATIARCQEEMGKGELPALNPIKADLSKYETIYLGYPVWFGTFAMPMQSLLKEQTFEGKKVVPFCTFGSGGLVETVKKLKEMLPKAEVLDGYGVRTARVEKAPAEINRFLIERGLKEGEIEALPGFLEHQPVTPADAEVFNQACSSYQFPLGTPEDVAIRETETSTDYEFTASNAAPDGSKTYSTIYVTVAKEEGAKPEFTLVVR